MRYFLLLKEQQVNCFSVKNPILIQIFICQLWKRKFSLLFPMFSSFPKAEHLGQFRGIQLLALAAQHHFTAGCPHPRCTGEQNWHISDTIPVVCQKLNLLWLNKMPSTCVGFLSCCASRGMQTWASRVGNTQTGCTDCLTSGTKNISMWSQGLGCG